MPPHVLNDSQFSALARIAYDRWGLELTDRKRVLVNNRISKLLRNGAYETVDVLLKVAQAEGAPALDLFDVLSTNHTSFFRESAHFDCLVKEIIKPAADGKYPGNGRLRFWSAACSNGSEPYTLSMVINDNLPDAARRDVRILATDLSKSALNAARRAVYPQKSVRDLPEDCVQRHFESHGELFAVRPHVRGLVTFGVVNLIEPWKMRGPFDAIFCRNVMIYFDKPTKTHLIERLRGLLRPDGLLFVGSSESLVGQANGLQIVTPGAYRKIG